MMNHARPHTRQPLIIGSSETEPISRGVLVFTLSKVALWDQATRESDKLTKGKLNYQGSMYLVGAELLSGA